MAFLAWQNKSHSSAKTQTIASEGSKGILNVSMEKQGLFKESTALRFMKSMGAAKPSPGTNFSALNAPPGNESGARKNSGGASALGYPGAFAPDFSSDLGRKKFGFSREEIDATAYYEGQFKLYQRSGQGTLHFPETGAKYVGQFSDDAFHGEGYRVWADGSEYHGQWVHGQKHGKGEFVSPENLRYTGQWESGRRHGHGRQEYANGDHFDGWWYNGMCSGLGSYHFADGSRYEGAWANGRYDGTGVLIKSDGSREKQLYKAGVLQSRDVVPGKQVIHKNKVRQKRETMQQPYSLPTPIPSIQLITRETAGEDLSAAPVTERLKRAGTAPPMPLAGEAYLPGQIEDVEDRAKTAPAQHKYGL
eukprot:gnl/MRDRNA2_/MRDRNA2_73589_c0_seq1.p1 gnl/MRDRNA2_/MRDRNA2_73589_c0~~gnl/MRDRNA2_/MRDRNA2_73589_c0_seq1.p1  ORF type:complete len:379 (-),score=74.34 gnl/MRDRNA2_/MRDRNA2_73589_c0_seq1:108-1193(-)